MRPIELNWRLRHIFWDTALTNNLILAQAIGICPIIAVAYRLQYGVVLAACGAMVLLGTSVLMSLVGERLPDWLRPPLYTVASSLLLWGAAWLLDHYLSREVYAALYLYLPLMAVNALNYRAGGFSTGNRPAAAVVDSLGSALGFAVVICLVSALRELMAYGTLWEHQLVREPLLTAADKPFVAFFMLAGLAALLQGGKNLLRRAAAAAAAEEAAEEEHHA